MYILSGLDGSNVFTSSSDHFSRNVASDGCEGCTVVKSANRLILRRVETADSCLVWRVEAAG